MGESGEFGWSAGSHRRSASIGKVEQVFLGRFDHTIDEKGRITIPSRFRELLENGAYLTRGFDKNLLVIPAPAFEELYLRITALSITDSAARILRRNFFTPAARLEFDRAGRILIPPYLREAAQLRENVIIAGTGEGFEIWAAEHWQEQEDLLQNPDALQPIFNRLDISLR